MAISWIWETDSKQSSLLSSEETKKSITIIKEMEGQQGED